MSYKTHVDLRCDTTIVLGGTDKNGKPFPKQVEGYYLGAKDVTGSFGEAKLHIFQTGTGSVGVWGKTDLNHKLTLKRVGEMCLVTFKGMSNPQKGRRPAYLYELKYDDENRIDVGTLDTSSDIEDDVDMVGADDITDYDPGAEEPALDEVKPSRSLSKGNSASPGAALQKQVQERLAARKSS